MRLGGAFGTFALGVLAKRFAPLAFDYENNDPDRTSRLGLYFGASLDAALRDRVVLDFGCGRGADVVAIARAGAAHVIGVDVNEDYLTRARALAIEHGVVDRCTFVNAAREPERYRSWRERCDTIVSIDAFEHFRDPRAMLGEMVALLRPGGTLLVSFGPPWQHPYGAHMNHFTTLPWIHMLFDEATILAVRERHVRDGVTHFEDLPGGLNRMTVARFEALVAQSGLAIASFEPVAIRGLSFFTARRATREYFTSIVKAILTKSGDAASLG